MPAACRIPFAFSFNLFVAGVVVVVIAVRLAPFGLLVNLIFRFRRSLSNDHDRPGSCLGGRSAKGFVMYQPD